MSIEEDIKDLHKKIDLLAEALGFRFIPPHEVDWVGYGEERHMQFRDWGIEKQ